MLIVCTARPELLERRPALGRRQAERGDVVARAALGSETAQLIVGAARAAAAPAETQAALLDARAATRCTPSSTRGCSRSVSPATSCSCPRRCRGSSLRGSTRFRRGEGAASGRGRRRQGVLARRRSERRSSSLHALERKEFVRRARRTQSKARRSTLQAPARPRCRVRADPARGAGREASPRSGVDRVARPSRGPRRDARAPLRRALELARAAGRRSGHSQIAPGSRCARPAIALRRSTRTRRRRSTTPRRSSSLTPTIPSDSPCFSCRGGRFSWARGRGWTSSKRRSTG